MTRGVRKPRLGQHFLRDVAVLAEILAAADVQAGETVLEVGPGHGVLTRPLMDAVGPDGRVVAVEADGALARALRADAPPNLDVRRGDALRVDLDAWGPYDRIVSNLPYQISGPFVARMLEMLPGASWRRAVLLVQREFGLRLLAAPRSKDYGRLSVHVQRHCVVERVRDVPPGCFDPPPDVHSMVVRLAPHPSPPFPVADERLWRAVVDTTFGARRKQLRNTLPRVAGAAGLAVLDGLGWQRRRPEELSPPEFGVLVARLVEARATFAPTVPTVPTVPTAAFPSGTEEE